MRQTSRAVALLLAVESAQATLTVQTPTITGGQFYFTTVFYPEVSDANGASVTMQLNSRTAGFTMANQVYGKTIAGAKWTFGAVPYQLAVAVGDYSDSKAAGGSACMTCLGGDGIWCSRTYSYLETAPGDTPVQSEYNYELTSVKLSLMSIRAANLADSEVKLTTGLSLDQGSCCYGSTNFQTFIGNQASILAAPVLIPNDAADPITKGVVFVDASCVALKNVTATNTITANKWGAMQIDDEQLAYSSWWCSNGLYKKITSSTDKEVNAQQIIGNGVNKRLELAMVGCPQKTLMCGNGTSITTSLTTGTAAQEMTVGTTLTVNDKCTWVAIATIVAPTFKFGAPGDKGLTSTNWQIHAMEFTSTATTVSYTAAQGSLQDSQPDAQDGYIFPNSAVQKGTYIPRFNMPADQFATLRTWYGEASVKGELDPTSNLPAAWLTPGQAPVANGITASMLLASVPGETYGNVVNVPFSTISAQTGATTPVGDTSYGTYNGGTFDLRAARYFPAKVAQIVHAAGTEQALKYTNATASFATAKVAWDNYVALLEKNAKTDAFAALFSPPKSPTVPPLPSLPWMPAAYAGYVRATAAEQNLYRKSSTTFTYDATTNPTAQQFWTNITAAQTVGGWGSFTAQVLRFRNGWGKSFGTIGYSGAATNDISVVWNYMWTCAASTSAPGTTPCDGTYTNAIGATQNTASATAGNLTVLVSVVSLWSTANSDTNGAVAAYAFSTQSTMTLTWLPGAWSGSLVALKAIAAPVAATAAKGLSGVAGAQALAATSAAALAVAAALY